MSKKRRKNVNGKNWECTSAPGATESDSKKQRFCFTGEDSYALRLLIIQCQLKRNNEVRAKYDSSPRWHTGSDGLPVTLAQFEGSVVNLRQSVRKEIRDRISAGLVPVNPDYFPGGVVPQGVIDYWVKTCIVKKRSAVGAEPAETEDAALADSGEGENTAAVESVDTEIERPDETRLMDRVLRAIISAGDAGRTRTDIHVATGGNYSYDQIYRALLNLSGRGLVYPCLIKSKTGKMLEGWRSGKPKFFSAEAMKKEISSKLPAVTIVDLDGVYAARKEINEKLAEIFAGLIELCHFAENYAEFYQDFIKSDFES